MILKHLETSNSKESPLRLKRQEEKCRTQREPESCRRHIHKELPNGLSYNQRCGIKLGGREKKDGSMLPPLSLSHSPPISNQQKGIKVRRGRELPRHYLILVMLKGVSQ